MNWDIGRQQVSAARKDSYCLAHGSSPTTRRASWGGSCRGVASARHSSQKKEKLGRWPSYKQRPGTFGAHRPLRLPILRPGLLAFLQFPAHGHYGHVRHLTAGRDRLHGEGLDARLGGINRFMSVADALDRL